MFEFNYDFKEHDDRSHFANTICKVLVEKSNNDIDLSVNNIKKIYDYFEEYVRNVYELIDEEIPLFALYELKTQKPDNWDFTEQEYNDAIDRTYKACITFYIKTNND